MSFQIGNAQLGVHFTGDLGSLQRALDQAGGSVDRFGSKSTAQLRGLDSALDSVKSRVIGLGGALAAGLSVRSFVQAADAVTMLENKLKLATGSAQSASAAYEQLFAVAQQSRVGFTDLGGTFSAIARATKELGVSQGRLMVVTQAIGNAMTISGGGAESMNAALVQLGQGIASGVLRGEELNSVMEQTPRLAKAIADGLGVTIGQLRELGAAGKLTADQVIKALESQAGVLGQEVGNSVLTVSQAMTQLQNATTKTVGEIDSVIGASSALASSLSSLSDGVSAVGKAFKENETTVSTAMGVLAGAATVAGLARVAGMMGGVAGGIGIVRTAFMALTAVMAANPVTLALLGVGAAVGGFVTYNNAAAQTVEGMERRIRSLQDRIKQGPSIYARDAAGMADWQKRTAAMRTEIEQLQAELAKKKGPISLGSVGSGDAALLRAQRAEYDAMGQQRAEFLAAARTDTQKLNDKLAEARKAFGGIIPPEVEASIREKFTKPMGAAKTATRAVVDEFERLYGSLTAKNVGLDADFYKNLETLYAGYQKGRIGLDEYRTAVDMLVGSQSFAVEAAKALAEVQQQAAKAYTDNLKVYQDAAKSAQDRATAMAEENEAIALSERLNIGLARAVELTTIARLKEKQVQAMGDEAAVLAIQKEIEARERLVQMMEGREVKEAADKLRRDEAAAWAKTWDQVAQSFTDALMQGGKSVSEYLKNLFRTLVLRPILDPIGKGLVGLLSGGGAGTAMAGQGGVGGGFNIISGLQGAYSQLTGGLATTLSGVGSAVGSIGAAMQYGTTMFSQQSMMLAAQEAGMGTMAGTMGTVATALGGALVGFMAGKMISGGYSAIGKSGNAATVAGTAIGFAVGGPIGAAIGGALGGVFNRAFGRKAPVVQSQGISGTFSTDGADVRGYADMFAKGGWFRSNKSWTEYSALDADTTGAINQSLAFITAATKGYANILGLNAEAINGITKSVRIDMQGLKPEERQAKLTEALTGFGDTLAEHLLGTFEEITTTTGRLRRRTTTEIRWIAGEYVRTGETAGQALERLATSLSAVNGTMGVLRLSLLSTSLAGGDAASKLVDLFGGIEKFGEATTAYYQTYYSDAEKARDATEQLTRAFADMGVTAPISRQAFRDLVAAQDLNTEAGRRNYAALIALAPAFDQATAATQKLAEETAARLIATFTANGRLVPVLDANQLALAALSGSLTEAQVRAGALTSGAAAMGFGLDGARVAAAALNTGMSALEVQQLLVKASSGQLSGSLSETQVRALALATGLTEAQVRAGALTSGAQAMGSQLADAAAKALGFTGPLGTISRQLGDASSGVLVFGDRLVTATAQLNPAQAAVQQLQLQMIDLRNAASGTMVDMVGLSAALRNVDTKTFTATVVGVFELIGQRIKDALGKIADERIAVREAAATIIGPGLMTAAQIRQQIAANMVGLPSNAALAAAQDQLAQKDAGVAGFSRLLSTYRGAHEGYVERLNTLRKQTGSSPTQELLQAEYIVQSSLDNISWTAGILNRLIGEQALAAQGAKQAQLDYVAALQKYSLDASKAVTQLGRLREETVRYYESQQQLSNLMTGAASTLRATVAQVRFDQLNPAQQLASLQERFSVAYSMALSTSGETLAGYGNELNSLITPLLQKAQEAGLTGSQYSNLVTTILARAEAVAGRLDQLAPKDYQAESLGLLGQIDSTLAALEKGAKTADQLIVDAVNAGKDVTRDGLRAVVAALTGKPVPAFATGGYHLGGWRIVGENGPELEATGPSRIFSAAQTARMLSGGGNSQALLQELQALRGQVASMERQMVALQTQTVVNTGKTARTLDRFDGDGLPVRNADGTKIKVEAA